MKSENDKWATDVVLFSVGFFHGTPNPICLSHSSRVRPLQIVDEYIPHDILNLDGVIAVSVVKSKIAHYPEKLATHVGTASAPVQGETTSPSGAPTRRIRPTLKTPTVSDRLFYQRNLETACGKYFCFQRNLS